MTCPDCKQINLDGLDVVELCPKHSMLERLVEALRKVPQICGCRTCTEDFQKTYGSLLKEYDQLEGK